MELRTVDLIRSKVSSERLRLVGEVHYDNPDYGTEYYWFDFDGQYAEHVNQLGNAWLVCLIPLAVTLNETLKICQPVDPLLFENVHELMRVWNRWYSHRKTVGIEAELDGEAVRRIPRGFGASLFSGGVDSFFTVLRHNTDHDWPGRKKINDLLCIWGFDIPPGNPAAFGRMKSLLDKAARSLDKNLIDIGSNLRETKWMMSDWAGLSHACFLASVGLCLEPRYDYILIPSSFTYEQLHPWGSHTLTDPLLSTSCCRIFHDGASYDRIQKTEYISQFKIATASLKVCWDSQSDENCQRCSKCYRTIATMFLLGKLQDCKTLNSRIFKIEELKRVYIEDKGEEILIAAVRDLAFAKGEKKLARAINRSITLSRWANRSLRYLFRLKRIKGIGFVCEPFKRLLVAILPGIQRHLF
jgi:hypothetical protein